MMKKLCALLLTLCVLAGASGAFAQDMLGGWTTTETPEITEEVQAAFDAATEELVGVMYEPVAYLGYQLVSGMNYSLLCRATAVVPDAVPYYVLIYLYADLQGNSTITSIRELDIAALAVAEK